jgi:AraC family transcriptional regulator
MTPVDTLIAPGTRLDGPEGEACPAPMVTPDQGGEEPSSPEPEKLWDALGPKGLHITTESHPSGYRLDLTHGTKLSTLKRFDTACRVKLVASDRHVEIEMAAGQFMVLPRGLPVSIEILSPTHVISLAIEGEILRRVAWSIGLTSPGDSNLRLRAGFDDPSLTIVLNLLIHENESGGHFGRAYLENIVSLFAMNLLRKNAARSRRITPAVPAAVDYAPYVPPGFTEEQQVAIEVFMIENLGADISVQDVADVVGLSCPHFTRLFRRSYDTSPHQYLMKLRVEKARELISDTKNGLTLAEIAHEVGFCDQSHLTNVFKRHTGKTPGRFVR